jgi:hypothetical protein
MRKRKRQRHVSLESELKRLSAEKIKRDPKNRTRAELLAATLWNKSLSGDGNALRLLLERLPVTVPQSEAESATVEPAMPEVSKMDRVVSIMKALVSAGVVPIEIFERYRIKALDEEFENKNGDWNKTLQ